MLSKWETFNANQHTLQLLEFCGALFRPLVAQRPQPSCMGANELDQLWMSVSTTCIPPAVGYGRQSQKEQGEAKHAEIERKMCLGSHNIAGKDGLWEFVQGRSLRVATPYREPAA